MSSSSSKRGSRTLSGVPGFKAMPRMTPVPKRLQHPVRVDGRLDVAGDDARSRLDEGLHLLERVVDHQVAVLDEAVRDGLDNWWADCELGAENAVHDVNVHDAAACLGQKAQVVAEGEQVSCQHAGADRGPTVQQLPDGGDHFFARASSEESSLKASKASSGLSPSWTTLPTAWIMATGEVDWKMLRPMSTPAAPSSMAL